MRENKLHYSMNGWLIVDKKAGMTSMDVSREIIKALRQNNIHGLQNLSDVCMNFVSAQGNLLEFRLEKEISERDTSDQSGVNVCRNNSINMTASCESTEIEHDQYEALMAKNISNAATQSSQELDASCDTNNHVCGSADHNTYTKHELDDNTKKDVDTNTYAMNGQQLADNLKYTAQVAASMHKQQDTSCNDIDQNAASTHKQQDTSQGSTDKSIPLQQKQRYKMGHAGTLDPFATGLLPIAIGEATKLISLFMNVKKAYVFKMCFGQKRDTGDVTGKVIATDDMNGKNITRERLTEVIEQFIGKVKQTPHKMSAMKVDGKRAYDLFRENVDFELAERDIVIDEIRILDFKSTTNERELSQSKLPRDVDSTTSESEHNQDTEYIIQSMSDRTDDMNETDALSQMPNNIISETIIEAKLYVKCGKGTYVRSLCEDIASALDTYAYVESLDRVEYGNIILDRQDLSEMSAECLNTCTTVDTTDAAKTISETDTLSGSHSADRTIEFNATSPILDVSACTEWFDHISVTATEADILRHGCYVKVENYDDTEACVVLHEQKVICIAKCEKSLLKPMRVLKY